MLARKIDRLFIRYRDRDDGRALARVFDLVATDLYRFALHLSRDADEAEDLVQLAFLAAIERRDAYEARGRFFSWMAGILANEWRRRRRQAARSLDPRRLSAARATDVADLLADEEAGARVREALSGIPEPYRGVLELKLAEGLEAAIIARRLGRPEGTVRAQIHRGLDLLRRILPAGLASLVVTAMPRQALARVRDATLQGAGFATATGKLGLATLEATAAVAVLATAAVLLGVVLRDDSRSDPLETSRGIAVAPGRAEPRPEAAAAPRSADGGETPRETGAGAAPEELPGGWRALFPRLEVSFAGRRSLQGGEFRRAPAPPFVLPDLQKWRPRSSHLPSEIVEGSSFGPFERITGALAAQEVENPTGPALAQVFLDGLENGFLLPLALERRDRDAMHTFQRVRIASSLRLRSSEPLSPDVTITALLQRRDGIHRVPLRRREKDWLLEEELPLPAELEIRGGEFPVLRLLVWDDESKLEDLDRRLAEPRVLRIVDALSGARLGGLRPSLWSGSRTGIGIDLEEIGNGDYRIPALPSALLKGARLKLGRGDWLTPFPRLQGVGRRHDEPIEVLVLAAPRRPGRLLESDGRPAAGARLRVHRVAQEILFAAMTDEEGRFLLRAEDDGLASLKREDLDQALTVTLQTFDGRLGRFDDVGLRELLAGPVLKLEPGPRELLLRVVAADGEPVARAEVQLAVPDPDGSDAWAVGSDRRRTDDEGRCRLHGFAGDRVRIVVSAAGRLAETRVIERPGAEEVVVTLAAAAPITVVVERPPGVAGPWPRVLVAEESSPGAGLAPGLIPLDDEGRGSILAPIGPTYRISVDLLVGRRDDGLVFRAEKTEFEGLVAGSERILPLIAARPRQFEIRDADGELLRSALVLALAGPAPEIDPWNQRSRGFGGSWQPGYPVVLPLGSPSAILIAPGHRPRRVTIANDVASDEVVGVRLERGVRIAGRVAGPASRRGAVVNLELLDVPGIDLPASWLQAHDRVASGSFRVADDGSFVTPLLVPGRYRLSWMGQEFAVLALEADRDDLVLDWP